MRSKHRLFATTLAAVLVLSIVGPGLAMADHDMDDTDAGPSIDVEQTDGVVVTVQDENGTVENASVGVTLDDENATYDGAGEYVTDENGTVELQSPEETVNVTITAESANATGTVHETLVADGAEDEDANDAFGTDVQAYVHSLLNGDGSDVPMGYDVARFVTENNPGNAPDHAGPKDGTARPDHAGPDGERGPPEHAGPDGDKGKDRHDDEQVDGSDDGDEDQETADEETDDGDTEDGSSD